jgi:exonuclease III
MTLKWFYYVCALYMYTIAIICMNQNYMHDLQVSYGIGCEIGDIEGRSITIESNEFSLTNVYVPNSGDGLKRLDYRTNIWDTKVLNSNKNM